MTALNRSAFPGYAAGIMQDFARLTGLDPVSDRPKRYLWTDAFAVCNYLDLYQKTGDPRWRELALRLVDQVHHTLGRYRGDDRRTGWISGLSPEEGERHPTAGGLRIGKSLPERGIDDPRDDQREWDRDGQYFHYLTKWMHALDRVSSVTGDVTCLGWAIELACVAHARFTYLPAGGGRRRMYWKMSTDLTYPLVTSMGQHDPLDGLVTYSELRSAAGIAGAPMTRPLEGEIAGITEIGSGMQLATGDPLGIGGLLTDALRACRLVARGAALPPGLVEALLDAALNGLQDFTATGTLGHSARYRLAFRELGLSIGLAGLEELPGLCGQNPVVPGTPDFRKRVTALSEYLPVRKAIEEFWLDPGNQSSPTWSDHREINMVMLATSLSPDGFLGI